MTILKFPAFKASKELEAFVKDRCGAHFVCTADGKCIDSLEGLQAFKQRHGDSWMHAPIPVYPYREDSIWTPEADAAYQAYHDRMHATGSYAFNLEGETALACDHFKDAVTSGLCCTDALALFHIVRDRVAYMERHNGQEPPHRGEFVTACFRIGPELASTGIYLDQYANHFL